MHVVDVSSAQQSKPNLDGTDAYLEATPICHF